MNPNFKLKRDIGIGELSAMLLNKTISRLSIIEKYESITTGMF